MIISPPLSRDLPVARDASSSLARVRMHSIAESQELKKMMHHVCWLLPVRVYHSCTCLLTSV